MLVSMDRAGRIVVPKEIRERLSLSPDSELELTAEADGIRLTPIRRRGRVLIEIDGLPVIEPIESQSITDADVQRWSDADQR